MSKINTLKNLFLFLRIRIMIMGGMAFGFISPFESHLYGLFTVGFISFLSIYSAVLFESVSWLGQKLSYKNNIYMITLLDVVYFGTLLWLFVGPNPMDEALKGKIAVMIFPMYMVLFSVLRTKNNAVMSKIFKDTKVFEYQSNQLSKIANRVSAGAAIAVMGLSFLDLPNTFTIWVFGVMVLMLMLFNIRMKRVYEIMDSVLQRA